MRGHETFGRPPTLRPRSAATVRNSASSALPPELVAARASAAASGEMQLRDRLQSPRPGMVNANTDMERGLMSPPVPGGPSSLGSSTIAKPPMRPKSPATTGNRQASRQRLERAHVIGAAPTPPTRQESNQATAAAEPSNLKSEGIASPAVETETMKPATAPASLAKKRPSSAAVSSAASDRSARVPGAKSSFAPAFLNVQATTSKRPCSAGAGLSRSNRPSSAVPIPKPTRYELTSNEAASDNTQSEHQYTFVYAVPRHCLDPRLRCNPYEIVTISRAALFETNQRSSVESEAKCDYYTISAQGFTFFPKNDSQHGAFLSTAAWETQRRNFQTIASKPTFELFRYRKVFLAWKKWIRASKMEAARVNLLLEGHFSHESLSKAIAEVREQLRRLEECQLEWDFRGRSLELSQFAAANDTYLRAFGALTEDVHLKVQSILVTASRSFVDAVGLNTPDSSFPGDEFARSSRKCSNYHLFDLYVERELKLANADKRYVHHEHFRDTGAASAVPTTALKRPHTAGATNRRVSEDISRIRWTMAAIRRRRCAQLARFAQMVVFIELDAFEEVVRRNGDMVLQNVLRGANAGVIRRLTDVSVYELALRGMAKEFQHESVSTVVNTGSGTRREAGQIITRQQLKRLLRSLWESASFHSVGGNQRSESAVDKSSGSNGIWDQSKFEVAFCQELAIVKGPDDARTGLDVFTAEEILCVVATAISDALVLQPFDGDTAELFSGDNSAMLEPSTDTKVEGQSEPDAAPDSSGGDSLPSQLRAIGSIAPTPLFSLQLELRETTMGDFEIRVNPTLDQVVAAVQGELGSFLELFKALPSLVSHSSLRAIVDFAENLLASALTTNFAAPEQASSFDTTGADRPKVAVHSTEENEAEEMDALSIFDRLEERMQTDSHYQETCSGVVGLSSSAVRAVTSLASRYIVFLERHLRNEAVDFDDKARCFRAGVYQLRHISDDILDYHEQIRTLRLLKTSHSVQFIELGVHGLIDALLPSPTKCLESMHALLPFLGRERCAQLLEFISSSSEKIQKPSGRDLTEFTRYLLRLQEVFGAVDRQESELVFVQELFALLKRFTIDTPEDTLQLFELCDPEFSALRAHAQDAYASRESDINGFTSLLNEQIASLQRNASDLRTNASNEDAFGGESCADSRDRISKLERQAALIVERSESLNWTKTVFADISSSVMPPTSEFDELNELARHLKLKAELWEVLCTANDHLQTESSQSLRNVDLVKMTALSKHMRAVIDQAQSTQTDSSDALVLGQLEALQRTFEALGPIVRDLCNSCMADRHWTKLERKMETDLSVPEAVTSPDQDPSNTSDGDRQRLELPLSHLLAVNAVAHATSIRHVSEEATAEAAISESFESVSKTWEVKEAPVDQRKDRDGRDSFCVGDCGDLIALMEESEVLLRVMDFSSYARVVQDRLTKLLDDLSLTKDTTELLQICQQRWDHTQQLLSADFVRSFPDQAKLLQKHDAAWRALMSSLSKRPQCLTFGVSAENRQLLLEIVKGFDTAAKALAEHLEMKRQVFPAFFRLSNAELATLLAKSRDVHDIQPFLHQCFDNVGSIVFGTRDSFQDILSVVSRAAYPHPEVIEMGSNLKARGPPEQWLSALESRLVDRLRRYTKQAVTLLSQFKWATTEVKSSDMATLESLPLQSLLLADRIVRCQIVDECISPLDASSRTGSVGGRPTEGSGDHTATLTLSRYLERLVNSIQYQSSPRGSSIRVQQAKMSERVIVLLSSLRLQDMQFRDALALHGGDSLTPPSARSSSTLSIPWELQLKYRLDDSMTVGQECHVQLNTLDVPYGFNYADPCQATVLTPSSLRYLFSLSSCIRNAQAAVLVGESGAGKATLATQVSSVLGRQAFCTVVTPSTTYSHIGHLLSGALHSGGTFCVQFPVITDDSAQLLKVLTGQLAGIEQAALTGSSIAGVHRSPITFTPGTAMLVTCTFASSTTLRSVDGVRSWCESMARFEVAAVDFGLILEAILTVEGFADSGELSKMLVVVRNQAQSIRSMCPRPTDNGRGDEGDVFSLRVMKSIVRDVAQRVRHSEEEFERGNLQRYLLREAMVCYVRSTIHDGDTKRSLTAIITTVFPNEQHQHEWFVKQFDREEAGRRAEQREAMARWLHTACEQNHLTPRAQLIDDALTLSSHLNTSVGTILAGACGTGKTTTYRVLAKAIDLRYKPKQHLEGGDIKATMTRTLLARGASSSRRVTTTQSAIGSDASVSIRVVLPGALTLTQLYGSAFTDSRKDAASSVLGRLVREAQDLFASTAHAHRRAHSGSSSGSDTPQKQLWVVFDGAIETYWVETLMLLLKKQQSSAGRATSEVLLPFQNGEFMTLPPNLRFLFETMSLATASPAFATSNAILHLREDGSGGDTSKPIHMAFLHRFFDEQREKMIAVSTKLGAEISRVFDVVEHRLVDEEVLQRIQSVIEEYAPEVSMTLLQRLQGFVSLLQAVLHSIVSMSSDDGDSKLVSQSIGEDGHPRVKLSLRIAMGLVYSLLWGFAACINDNSQLTLLVSSIAKSAVPDASATWSHSGREINLFDTIADFAGARFILVDDALVAAAALKTRSVASHGSAGNGDGPETTALASLSLSQSPFLFVPTRSSLLVHSTMREALRTGRLVLLVGDVSSRRTTLLRCFMQQTAAISALLTEGSSSQSSVGGSSSSKRSGGISQHTTTSEEKTLESVNRIRFHQISLVMVLAARFQRDNQQAALSNGLKSSPSTASVATSQFDPGTSIDAPPIEPSWTGKMTDAVLKLDSNSTIPFFFGMTQHDHGALELAGCMERMLQRERAGVFEPPPGKAAVLFIDDLHLQSEPTADVGEIHPCCFDFLRSASEHGHVFSKPIGSAVTVENLFMVASTTLHGFVSGDTFRHRDALTKLAHRCFPMLAPSCSSSELCSIFSACLASRMDRSPSDVPMRLASGVKQELPSIVAASVVLWERLREAIQQPRRLRHHPPKLAVFNLHDLARVFQAIASVDVQILEDGEVLQRLWAHECARAFQDSLYWSEAKGEQDWVSSEVEVVRESLQQAKQLASKLKAGATSTGSDGHQGAQLTGLMSPHSGLLRAAVLHQLIQAELESSTQHSQGPRSHTKKSPGEVPRRVSSPDSSALWAFVPEVVLFERRPQSHHTHQVGSSKPSVRRSSRMLLRRASRESGSFLQPSRPATGWVYAELLDDAPCTREEASGTVQRYFGWIATASSRFSSPVQGSARWSVLPSDPSAISAPLSLAFTVARIERVRARTPSKLLLLGSPGSGRESLLQYIDASWQASHRQRTLKLVGTLEPPQTDLDDPSSESVVATKWREILRDAYDHVGLNCESVTLVIKRLDLIPSTIVNQLLSLMTTGDVPGAFTLDDQIKMATRVRDERLVVIEAAHQDRVAHIQAAVKTRRDREFELARQHELESRQAHSLEFLGELERRYRDILDKHLAQAELQLHQDMDDFVRRREVETESVTATIMSLMRPLGITSGKWQQIIDRIRKRLSVVVIVDHKHEPLVRTGTPQLFAMCDVVNAPVLSLDALRVLVYGHLLAEVQPALAYVVPSIPSTNISDETPASLSIESVKPFLWTLSGAAAEIHLAVSREASSSASQPPTSLAWTVASCFVKLLSQRSRDTGLAERKEQRFLDAVARFETALTRLRDSELDLPSRIESIQAEIAVQEAKADELKDNARRIREIMLRFQDAAEEQVRITNEMNDQAQRELQIPLACVDEANAALLAIDKRHIVEIKSFTSPPLLVHLVLDAICVLFRYEPTWENARKILGDPNVVQTMLTFDKDQVPVEILGKIEKDFLSDERFNRQDVERQSVAASMMVVWVRAVHQYASARLLVKPTLDRLDKAQARLKLLMNEFQVSKDRVVEAEVSWKATVTLGEELEKQKTELVAQCESRASRLESGQRAFQVLDEDRRLSQARMAQMHLEKSNWLAWWNALLDACALTYLGSLPYRQRSTLFDKWQQAYRRWSRVDDSEDSRARCILLPSLAVALSRSSSPSSPLGEEEDESIKPRDSIDVLFENPSRAATNLARLCASGTCFSRRRMLDVFLLSTMATTPGLFAMLITDFNEQLETLIVKCARGPWRWANPQLVYARAPDFDDVLLAAVRDGYQLLVLDVEPGDAVAFPGRRGLKAVLDWSVAEVAGVQYLKLSGQRTSCDGPHQVTASESVAVHAAFKIVLTSHFGQECFRDSLHHIPVVNAELDADEVQDAILDQLWAPDMEDGSGGGVFNLETALQDGMGALRERDTEHEMLVELTEEAATTGECQVPLMSRLQQQCTATKACRLAIQQRLAAIPQRIDRIRKLGLDLAVIGSAAFNALNATINYREDKPPPLALQVFLPMYYRALKPASAPTIVLPYPVPVASPMSSPRSRTEAPRTPRSLRSTALQVGRHVTMTRQGSGLDGDGAPTPGAALSRLLHLLDPLLSTESDRQQFLTRLYIALEEPRGCSSDLASIIPGSSSVVECDPEQVPHDSETRLQLQNAQPALIAARLGRSVDRDELIDAIRAIDGGNLGCNRAQVVATLLSTCLGEATHSPPIESSQLATLLGSLSSVPTRAGRIQASLCMFPELVPLLCQKAVHYYRDSSSSASLLALNTNEATGTWLTQANSFPETTATVLLTPQAFDSFSFLLHVLFNVTRSLEVRLAIMKHIAAQGTTSSGLTMSYRLPRSVVTVPESTHPLDGDDDHTRPLSMPTQLLLTLGSFQEMLELEKKHIDSLETIPMALINMSPGGQGQGAWTQLFRVLYRSVARASSITHSRRHISKSVTGSESLQVGKPPAALSKSDRRPPTRVPSSPRSTVTVRRESSSRSVTTRETEAALVTPPYPRIVSVVASADEIPRRLQKNAVCFQPSNRRGHNEDGTSLQLHLQAAVLRIVYYPFEAMVTTSNKPHGWLKASEDAESEAGKPTLTSTWPPEVRVLLTAIALFHALLAFRHEESLAVMGLGRSLTRYSDDALTTSVGQVAVIVGEFTRRTSDAKTSFGIEERAKRTILGVYTRLTGDDREGLFLEQLLWECLEAARGSPPPSTESQQEVADGGRGVTRPILHGRQGGRTRHLDCLSIPVVANVASSDRWLDEMWTRVRMLDQATESQVRVAFFGVSAVSSASEEALSERHYPWIHQLGSSTRFTDKTSFAMVVQAIQSMLESCRRTHQGKVATVEEAVVSGDQDTCQAIDNSEPELKLVSQVYATMDAAYSRLVLSVRQFFEDLMQRMDSQSSRELGTRRYAVPYIGEDDWVARQVAATMQNKIPTGLQAIFIAQQLHHPALSGNASLDDMLTWIESWSHFLLRQRHNRLPDTDKPDDMTTNSRCCRWWAPALEASAIPVAHVVELSHKCGSLCEGTLMFTLRTLPLDASIDATTPIQEQEEKASASSETFVELEGVWLFGATWNEALGWLEPAVGWSPQQVDVVGSIVAPTRGEGEDRGALPLDSSRPSESSTTPVIGERDRSVALLSAGSSKCLARWEIRASPALSTLATPYLATHR